MQDQSTEEIERILDEDFPPLGSNLRGPKLAPKPRRSKSRRDKSRTRRARRGSR